MAQTDMQGLPHLLAYRGEGQRDASYARGDTHIFGHSDAQQTEAHTISRWAVTKWVQKRTGTGKLWQVGIKETAVVKS